MEYQLFLMNCIQRMHNLQLLIMVIEWLSCFVYQWNQFLPNTVGCRNIQKHLFVHVYGFQNLLFWKMIIPFTSYDNNMKHIMKMIFLILSLRIIGTVGHYLRLPLSIDTFCLKSCHSWFTSYFLVKFRRRTFPDVLISGPLKIKPWSGNEAAQKC